MSEAELNYLTLIQQLIKNGDPSSLQEAHELATQWLTKEPENPRALLYTGDLYRRRGEIEKASAAYKGALETYTAQGKGIQILAVQKLLAELEPKKEKPLTQLPPTPLFSALPQEALQKIIAGLKLHTLADQEFVCKEGEPGNSIYVLSQGKVAVRIFNPNGTSRDLAELVEGSFFGEFAYFTKDKRQASVQAVGPIEFLELERSMLDALVKQFPMVEKVLLDFYRQRTTDSLLARSKLFLSLNSWERSMIAELFTVAVFQAGSTVLLEGDPGDTFYLIQAGEVEVFREQGGKKLVLARLAAGDFFGELALLTQSRRTASIRTLSDCTLLSLKGEQLKTILAQHPEVAATLKQIAEERLAITKPKGKIPPLVIKEPV